MAYGRLPAFQRHKLRLWSSYDLSLGRAGEMRFGEAESRTDYVETPLFPN